jgi:hypothetical protein
MEARRPKVTGKTAKTIKPLSRGANKGKIDSAVGFWGLLAGRIAIQKDGEDPKERGDRLEPLAIRTLAERLNLDADVEPGMWLSDEHEDIAITPDGAERSLTPTWGAEVKAIDSAQHLRYVITDRRARQLEGYKPIDYVPNEYSHCYREQCIQYFVVCETLQTLHFIMIDDRIALDDLAFHYITIKRGDVAEEIEAQKAIQLQALAEVDKLIIELTGGE